MPPAAMISTTVDMGKRPPLNSAQYKQLRLKFRLIKDVKPNMFVDLAVRIVKKFMQNDGTLELYVTDYTWHEGLADHDRSEQNQGLFSSPWPGPIGKYTLRVDLLPPHAAFAQFNTQEGDSVRLRNVRIKTSQTGELEGNIWQDRQFPDKVCVFVESGSEHQDWIDLEDRRNRHNAEQRKLVEEESRNAAANSNAARAPNVRSGFENNESTTSNKKKHSSRSSKKRKLPDDAKNNNAGRQRQNHVTSSYQHDNHPYHLSENVRAMNANDQVSTKSKLNTYVSSIRDDVPYSTFGEVIHFPRIARSYERRLQFELPFVNVKHHVVARVVDFFPHKIEDFCRSTETRSSQDHEITQWQWDFWLVLESGDKRKEDDDHKDYCLNVRVFGHEARMLLGSKASRWRHAYEVHPAGALSLLREKLFLLWGDLEENKTAFIEAHPRVAADEQFSAKKYDIEASNLPFSCAIGEGGIKAPGTDNDAGMGYRRVYSLLETQIRQEDRRAS